MTTTLPPLEWQNLKHVSRGSVHDILFIRQSDGSLDTYADDAVRASKALDVPTATRDGVTVLTIPVTDVEQCLRKLSYSSTAWPRITTDYATSWSATPGCNDRCFICGKSMIRTSNSYVSCPDAHGRLVQSLDSLFKAQQEIASVASRWEKAAKRYDRWCARVAKMEREAKVKNGLNLFGKRSSKQRRA